MVGFRVGQLLWQLIAELYQLLPENDVAVQLFNMHVQGNKINFLEIEKSGKDVMLSYLPINRVKNGKVETECFFTTGRQTGRIGATLRKVLVYDVSDAHLKKFTEALAALYLKDDYEISVVEGKDIRQYFLKDSYLVKPESELWKSCMRHQECQEFFGIYENNPNVSMVIAQQGGKLAARALIWSNVKVVQDALTIVENPNPVDVIPIIGKDTVTMLDRIYAIDPKAKNVLWRWGLENTDILHAIPKNRVTFVLSKDSSILKLVHLAQDLEEYKYYSYPWVDTLSFYSVEDKRLTNFQPLNEKHRKKPGMLFNSNDMSGVFSRLTTDSPDIEQIRRELRPNIGPPKPAELQTPLTSYTYTATVGAPTGILNASGTRFTFTTAPRRARARSAYDVITAYVNAGYTAEEATRLAEEYVRRERNATLQVPQTEIDNG